MIMDALVKISKTMFYSWFILFALCATLIIANRINKNHYEEEITNLEKELYLRNDYIMNISKTYKMFYNSCIVDETIQPIVHYIDSISFDFFNETKLLDYGVFAMDVNDYYDRIYYEMLDSISIYKSLN